MGNTLFVRPGPAPTPAITHARNGFGPYPGHRNPFMIQLARKLPLGSLPGGNMFSPTDATTPAEYLAALPEPRGSDVRVLDELIRREAPGLERATWTPEPV